MSNVVIDDFLKKIDEMYPSNSEDLKHEIKRRYHRYIIGEIGKPREVTMHTVERIIPCIALYEAFDAVLNDKSLGEKIIREYINEIAKNNAKKLQGILRLPSLYKLVPNLMAKAIHKYFGLKSNFEYDDVEINKKICHINMKKCPYHDLCCKYNHPELVTVFCDSDDLAYGDMHPNLSWERTMTLGRGNDCCDFILKVKEK